VAIRTSSSAKANTPLQGMLGGGILRFGRGSEYPLLNLYQWLLKAA
jgi:hypothetical protein